MKLVTLMALLTGALWSSVSTAEIFRCIGSDGHMLFTDRAELCRDSRTSIAVAKPTQRVNRQFISQIPDLLQTHPLGDFLKGGRNYCAPVAVANSLSWLAGKKSVDNQIHLAGRLANARYMNSAENGTTPAALLNGVDTFFKDNRQPIKKLGFQGWRSVPAKYRGVSSNKVDLNWLADGISDSSTVWLNVGWYRKTGKAGEYQRVGGHWVTLVGYELNNPRGAKNRLIVHDPAPRSGHEFANEFISVERQHSGHLVDKQGNKRQALAGLYRMSNGMHISERADFALLDGAVRLDI